MNRRRFLQFSLLSATCAAALPGCVGQSHTIRYRLRIAVKIDGRKYAGATVVKSTITDRRRSTWLPPEAPKIAARSLGEAVVVDMGNHGLLFGLLTPPFGVDGFNGVQPFNVLDLYASGWMADPDDPREELPDPPLEFELPAPHRPALVRFRDIRDPSTAELVEPEKFSSVYGPGAAFLAATISMTRDAVTTGLSKRLQWVEQPEYALPGNSLVGKPKPGFRPIAQMTLPERLSTHNFVRDGE